MFNRDGSETIYDASADDFAKELIGKSIKAIAGDTIELNDGTILELEDTSDCCAYFNGDLEVIDLTDNAVTGVEHVDRDPSDDSDYDEHWSIHILSTHKLIAKVNIDGNASNGYYCHSINLRVKRPVETN